MRQVLSLSLPQAAANEIKKSSKRRGFASVSEYVKYLYEMDQDLIAEKDLLAAVKEARSEYKKGKTVKAESLKDLV